MPYQRIPSYGRSVRPRPLEVANARAMPRRRLPDPGFSPTTSWQPQPPQPSRQSRSFKWPVLIVIVGAVFAFAVFHDFTGKENVVQAAFDTKSHKSASVQAMSEEKLRMENYRQTVNSLIAAHPDENIAVSAIDLSDNSSVSLGDPGTFTAASTAKLITAITLLHQVEQGQASLASPVDGQQAGDLLKNMIINSDNDAWNSLNNDYLSHDELKSYMASQGLIEYDPDVNTVQPSDMAKLMQKLYEGKLLDKAHTDLLLSYMQQANKQEYIVANVPSGYTVYHKAGWLDGLMHDVAIISNGKKAIVLTIYTYTSDGQGDGPANQALFKSITQASLKAYFPAS